MKSFKVPLFLAAISLIPCGAGALNIQFEFTDAAGVGFNDATLGAQRRAALQGGADLLGAYFVNYSQTVTISVDSVFTGGSLAQGGSPFWLMNGFNRTFVQSKILTGVDEIPGSSHGSITWDFGHTWDYDDNIAAGAFDFKAVAMHEMLHTFGFSSLITKTGQGLEGNACGTPDTWSTFDRYLTDSTGAALINQATYSFDATKLGALTSGMFFAGENAKSANGGTIVLIYSPSTWAEGSSGSHVDDSVVSDALMGYAVAPGLATRVLSAVEMGILKDIGYADITAVPEPATYGLMGAGVVAFAAIVRRRRRANAA